jgi:hypothetical protein
MATAGMAITVDWGSEHSVNAATPALKQIKGLDFIVLSFLIRLIGSLSQLRTRCLQMACCCLKNI